MVEETEKDEREQPDETEFNPHSTGESDEPDPGPETGEHGKLENREDALLSRPVEGRFVDFDVWVVTLEANFGPDFEAVLSREFGPDWSEMINTKIAGGDDFQQLVQELRSKVLGAKEDERDERESIDEGDISFEALGDGEIIGGSGHGHGGVGGGSRDHAPLAHAFRREFTPAEKLKIEAEPDKFSEEKVLLYHDKDSQEHEPDDDLVMMDRRDFSRLSYYASKEMRRHEGEDKPLKTAGNRGGGGPGRAGPLNHVGLALGAVLLAYAFFSLGSYIYFSIRADRMIDQFPPDLIFRPSTSLHRQGGLSLAVNGEERPLIVFSHNPRIQLLEINRVSSSGSSRFDLAQAGSSLLIIPSGPGGDSVSVRLSYNQHLPMNIKALAGRPLLSLSLAGNTVLATYETLQAAVFPGHNRYELRDGGGVKMGEAYLARGQLNIVWDDSRQLQGPALDTLSTRLVLLFTLLDI